MMDVQHLMTSAQRAIYMLLTDWPFCLFCNFYLSSTTRNRLRQLLINFPTQTTSWFWKKISTYLLIFSTTSNSFFQSWKTTRVFTVYQLGTIRLVKISPEIPVDGNGESVGVLCKPLLEQDKIEKNREMNMSRFWIPVVLSLLFLSCAVFLSRVTPELPLPKKLIW